MKILINSTNSLKGGSLQVALSYVREFVKFTDNEYYFFIAPEANSQINKKEYPENFHFFPFSHHITSIVKRIATIRLMDRLEKEIQPHCVITPFGPSYWTPEHPHLVGFGRGYYIYPESPFFRNINTSLTVKIKFLKVIHRYFFRANSDYCYVESEDARKRLSLFLGRDLSNIYVLPNTYHPAFNLPTTPIRNFLPPRRKNEIRLLTLSAYYPHKNLEVIPEVLNFLKKKSDLCFAFILTIDNETFNRKFSCCKNNIINLGPIPIDLCPKLYEESDIMFLPTLIEIFTASYPESMKMKKPILTSDLSFAREICGDAAGFFNPSDPEEIADMIIRVVQDHDYRKSLIHKGESRLIDFETPESRVRKLLAICTQISGGVN